MLGSVISKLASSNCTTPRLSLPSSLILELSLSSPTFAKLSLENPISLNCCYWNCLATSSESTVISILNVTNFYQFEIPTVKQCYRYSCFPSFSTILQSLSKFHSMKIQILLSLLYYLLSFQKSLPFLYLIPHLYCFHYDISITITDFVTNVY